MEEFSQSRGEDDLFDDEIIPIDPSQIETVTVKVQDISLDNAPKGPANNHPQRGHGPRGRGRGGRGRGNNELMNLRFAPQTQAPPPPLPPSEPIPEPQKQISVPDGAEEEAAPATEPQTSTTEDPTATESTDPALTSVPATPARPPAVRGDRTATGGIKKPKLTEDELTAKLAAAKERSQNLSAAHARAQADAAAYEEREKIAQAKRAKDVVARKMMDTEREKNRARKMAGAGGREWDEQKDPEEFNIRGGRGRGNGYTRGAHGGVRRDPAVEEGDADLRQYEWHEDRGRGRGRGRGMYGRGRGRGDYSGRGNNRNGNNAGTLQQPDISAETEFPALPEKSKDVKKPTGRPPPQARTSSEVLSSTEGGGTWADQVESSEMANYKW